MLGMVVKTPGAIGKNKSQEKDVNLAICKETSCTLLTEIQI